VVRAVREELVVGLGLIVGLECGRWSVGAGVGASVEVGWALVWVLVWALE
jgi:hypothetical protein